MTYKWMVCGHAQHGKDTATLYLSALYPLKYESSSLFACRLFIFETLAPLYGYKTVEECYADRHAHRKEWFDLIVTYNGDDLGRMSKELFDVYEIYCGIRNVDELNASKAGKYHDFEIWVDASKRMPLEDASSITVTANDCSIYVDNNGPIDNLFTQLDGVMTSKGIVRSKEVDVVSIEHHLPDPLERGRFIRALASHLNIQL